MTTLTELVASISASMHSFTGLQEQVTWLTAGCDASTTTLTVNSSDTVMRGIAEIDDELVYVHTTSENTLTLAPFGRGYRGSTAAAHSTNTEVRFDPAFPRVEIVKAIHQCVEAMFPTLYQIKTVELPYQATDLSHTLPSDVEQVLSVTAKALNDPHDYWGPLNRWDFDPNNTAGNVLNVYGSMTSGATLRVVYTAKFGTLTTDFASAGLSESYADLILYSVAARMIRFLDPARLNLNTVENLSRAQVTQVGDAGRVANQMFAMYQTRLAEERKRLLALTPPVPHFLPR